MNEVDTQSKSATIKTLAIIGFIATLVLVVWIAVQVIRVLPGAFTSLASIADSIAGYRPAKELTVSTEKSVVNAGESFTISWTDMKRDGDYTFTYACTEGVSLDMRVQNEGGNDIFMVPCDTTYQLPENIYAIDVMISSEKQRFIDVPYTLTLIDEDDKVLFERDDRITVVNATIPQSSALAQNQNTNDEATDTTNSGDMSASEEEETTTPSGDVLGESTSNNTTGNTSPTRPTTQTPATPVVTTQTYTYMPQSDPNGYTDLAVSYLGVGSYNNQKFVPSAVLDNDGQSAVKFEVKNIGTKTSRDWNFEATLPNGVTYTSKTQEPLKPNERAEYTLGFALNDETGVEQIEIELNVSSENNKANNAFNWSVAVTD